MRHLLLFLKYIIKLMLIKPPTLNPIFSYNLKALT